MTPPNLCAIEDGEDGETLVIRWGGKVRAFFFLSFAGFMAFVGIMAWADEPALWMLCMCLAMVTAFAYAGVTTLLNTTRVRLGRDELEVTSGPIPSGSNVRIPKPESLRVESSTSSKGATSIQLWAVGPGGEDRKIITGTLAWSLDREQIDFLHYRIQLWLGTP